MIRNKLIAIFISSLILFLPVYSASVYAGLTNLQVKGIDNVNGYIRQNDFIEFSVTASIDGDSEITTNQVYLKNVKHFDSCNAGVSGYDCNARIPETGIRSFTPSSIPFTIELYDDTSILTDSVSSQIVVDNQAPRVSSFSITPRLSNDGIVTFNYAVEDYAYTIGDTSKCSGIEKIEFHENNFDGVLLDTETLQTADCSVSDTKQYTSSADGEVTVCAKVYDRFLQQSTALVCDTFTVDRSGPVINADSFRVLYNNNEILYFKDTPITVDVSVNITSSDLDAGNVFADLSALNPNGVGYGNLRATCTRLATDVFKCRWQIELKPAASGSLNVDIKARDLIGNEVTQTISRIFTEDLTGPVVSSLATDKVSGSDYFVGSRGNFIAQIDEDVGVNRQDIMLHVGSNVYMATICERGWTCYWNNILITQPEGPLRISIGTDSKDILRNFVAQEFSIDVTVDKTAPRNAQIEISAVGGTQSSYEEYIKTGDRLAIVATVEEKNPLYAFANLSSIISGATTVAAESCSQDETNVYTCVWNTDRITIEEYTTATLKFNFTDAAGNSFVKEEEIEVYGVEELHEPFYDLAIDRRYILPIYKEIIATLASEVYYQTIPVNLGYKNNCEGNDIEILRAGLSPECGGYVNLVKNGNNYAGFVQFNLNPLDINLEWDKVEIGVVSPCYLQYNVRCGGTFYSLQERKNISINIPLISTDPAAESVTNEIERITDSVTDFYKIIIWANKLSTLSQNSCEFKAVIGSISTIIDALGMLFGACVDSVAGEEIGCAAYEAAARIAKGEVGSLFEGLYNHLDTLCNLATCRPTTAKIPGSDKSYSLSWMGGYCSAFKDSIKYKLGKDDIKKVTIPKGEEVIEGKLDVGYTPKKEGSILSSIAAGGWAPDVQYFEMDTLELSKRSWLFSAGCLCIPGIIYNLQKYKQLECKKAVCLRDLVPAGFPVNECKKQYEYESCVNLHGEWTAVLDFLIGQPIKVVLNMLSNPLASVWSGFRYAFLRRCVTGLCTPATCVPHWKARCIPYSVMVLLESAAHMADFWLDQDYKNFRSDVDYCGMLEENPLQGEFIDIE